ncbi:hypothetical protein Prudu_004691 [Prunus dulcis]|uniref:Disease resistance protein TIR-NBS-LRR class family n=1 Tax=Prunus dulcis TaxID=3755 RepID=A0A4Y1QVX9_PRUDU|nr:hypothetical protein Prudu_004691 [Prunus dulcis]
MNLTHHAREAYVSHGSEEIEGVALDCQKSDAPDWLKRSIAQAFTKMKKLRLLHLSNVELTGEFKDFPKTLIWLCWHGFPLESIPDDFPMQPKLVALDLQRSKLKIVWKDCKLHQNLKILNLSCSYWLIKSPEFSKLPNLEELILEYCKSLLRFTHPSGILEDFLCRLKLFYLMVVEGLKSWLRLRGHGIIDNSESRILPSLRRLSQLQDLSLDFCTHLRAITDLPTNLKVLKADGCFALEKMPDFSEMSNIRELYLRDSDKLTEIPCLDKSLNSMTMIQMGNCTNLTANFRKNILQGWTSCGYGGISLSGNDIPDWFHCVHDDDIVYFIVPQSVGRILKGLTLFFIYSPDSIHDCEIIIRISISIKNITKGTELDARIKPVSNFPIEDYYLWQGQLSNDELKLQDGDKVLIEIISEYKAVKVKKTGVSLAWDKFMNENMIDYHLCAYERRPYLVNDDDIIHVKYDNHITESPDFSKFPNLEKLILKFCRWFYKVHSFIGDLGRLSLVNIEYCRDLKDLPLNFYKSKSIETLILNGCSLSVDAIPKDLCSLISLEDLLLGDNDFCSLPSLAGLSKLKVLCVNACENLRAIPDLPTNLFVLKANDCPKLETIPDFSKNVQYERVAST